MNAVSKTGPRPSDKWIPWCLVFFFVLLLTPLAPMAYLAVHTLPGVVTENSYEKGLAYNKAIDAGAKQQALGWKGDISLDFPAGALNATANYVLRDAQGNAIDDAEAHVWLVRPAQGGVDRDASLKAVGGGHYAASINLPARGVWDVRVSATRHNQNFQTTQRIVVP